MPTPEELFKEIKEALHEPLPTSPVWELPPPATTSSSAKNLKLENKKLVKEKEKLVQEKEKLVQENEKLIKETKTRTS